MGTAVVNVADDVQMIDGQALESEAVIRSVINDKKPGETVSLEVYRSSSDKTLTIELKLSEYTGE